MVVLTNEPTGMVARHPKLVRTCTRCRRPRWAGQFRSMRARRCLSCEHEVRNGTCTVCGGTTPPPVHGPKPRTVCDDPVCMSTVLSKGSLKARARHRAKLATRTTRHCAYCGETKPLDAFGTGNSSYWCRSCRNAVMRDRYRNDERVRQQTLERVRRAHERHTVRMQDPAYAEAYRAKDRARRRAREERRQQEEAQQTQGNVPGYSGTGPSMPVAPLWAAVERFMEDRGMTKGATAALFGTSERSLWRWEHDGAWVRLEQADAALVAMDMLWFEVWDEAEYPEVAAIWEGEA